MDLLRSKVVWTGIAAIAVAIGASPMVSGEMTWNQVLAAVGAAAWAIFNRHSQMKGGRVGK